jgi:2-(3-amino-3-carboxypropyl)histidine synthase
MVSTKDGQFNLGKALELKDRLESKNREALIFAGDELTPNNLLPFRVDCWVNTACPRLVEDKYHRPVVNSEELEEFINYL